METELVKENVRVSARPLGARWLAAAAAATALALAAVAWLDAALPPPRDRSAPKDTFIAEIAREHLINLTSIGPRVAGSYENEVLAVAVVSAALRGVARAASRHNRLDVDLHSSAGAFPLTFLDGMNNVYRGVQSVVARLSGVGSTHGPALLINCHFDSVPDSPGASDDAAGCAVGLEVLRALAAADRPLRRDVLLLLNGAEENIMQASHSFITAHRWARQARVFVNIEACGAGGREVLFQAGPHDPWVMEVYASAVPRPFASSLAQELFESGLIPGDTDFRVFRDFGNLSGVDLAWSSNGYVYHTRLDTWQSVPAAALQRTGDNVLALAKGMLEHPAMDGPPELEPQPVFFDVLGLVVVCARGHAAAAAAVATIALVALRVHVNARDASKRLYMRPSTWWVLAGRGLLGGAAGLGCGLAAAGAAAAVLQAAGRSMPYYTSTWLLAPLYVLPALCAGCWATAGLWRRWAWARARAPLVRGWWAARLAADALALGWALLLGTSAAAGLRSGYVPLLPALLPTAADLAATLAGLSPGWRAWCWALGWALPVLQLWYLAVACLTTLVPLAGRAGAPADVAVALLGAAGAAAPAAWLVPLYLVTRDRHRLMSAAALCSGLALALVLAGRLGAPYSAGRPQRVLVFHTRRTDHSANTSELLYWAPHVDANARRPLDEYVSPALGGAPAVEMSASDCARHVYCGAPYFLPARGLIRRGYWLPAPAGDAPLARLAADVTLRRHNRTHHTVTVHVTDGGSHVVVLVSPTAGGSVSRYWAAGSGGGRPVPALPWGPRRTYCCTLHQPAAAAAAYSLQLDITHPDGAPADGVASLSVAAHAMFGARMRTATHAALLARLPPSAAATGWGVDLHLYRV